MFVTLNYGRFTQAFVPPGLYVGAKVAEHIEGFNQVVQCSDDHIIAAFQLCSVMHFIT